MYSHVPNQVIIQMSATLHMEAYAKWHTCTHNMHKINVIPICTNVHVIQCEWHDSNLYMYTCTCTCTWVIVHVPWSGTLLACVDYTAQQWPQDCWRITAQWYTLRHHLEKRGSSRKQKRRVGGEGEGEGEKERERDRERETERQREGERETERERGGGRGGGGRGGKEGGRVREKVRANHCTTH